MFSQCLRRYAQSTITKKVNCLSGCNQILRVSKETCGNAILSVLNYLPEADESIFNHIRSYASEDRNHVCHMLSMYPYVKSTQTLKAIAYTSVPTSVDVFMSQRRRWNLGAMTNDMLLVYLPDINIFERISAFVNVATYSLTPFIFIATIAFIKAIIEHPSMLMLYLSIIIFIPFLYALCIPVFIRPLSFRNAVYFYMSYLFFILFGSFVKLVTYGYSTAYMDVIKWGKTRANEMGANEMGANEIGADTNEIGANEMGANEIGANEIVANEIVANEIAAEAIEMATPTSNQAMSVVLDEYISIYCTQNSNSTNSNSTTLEIISQPASIINLHDDEYNTISEKSFSDDNTINININVKENLYSDSFCEIIL
jgi:hypothetical protein